MRCSMTFKKALLVSMGIHVLIFGSALAFAQFTGGLFRNETAVVTVSLVSGGGTGRAAGRRGPETASPIPVSVTPQPLPVPETASGPAVEERTGEPGLPMSSSAGAGAAAAGQGEGSGPAVANGTGNSSTDAFSSEQWRQLQSAIERAKTYPRFAREQGIEGTVLVRFKVLPTGDVETVNVVRSSGARILDEASIKTVYRAAPMPFVSGWVEVPMSYVLK